jgi:hypothetical protein
LAIVAAVAIGANLGAACGDDEGRPDGAGRPRDDEITATIDGVWQAVGADPETVDVAEYAYRFLPDDAACADLERDDRWYGQRGSTATLRGMAQSDIEAAIVDHLDGEGFTVQRFRSTHPDSPLRAYLAVRDEVVVDGTVDPDGYTTVSVRSGPCAASQGDFDPDLFEPAD